MGKGKHEHCWKHVTRVKNGVKWICNMASTSSNPPPEAVINRLYSTQDQGVNGSGGNRSVSESEINQLKQLVLDLECEKKDIAKQLRRLESRGKERKPEVDVWLRKLQDMKGSMYDMNNLNGTLDATELIKNMKRHKEEKPIILSTEFVGRELEFKIKRVFKLLEDDKVFVIGICGMGAMGKTLLAALVEKEGKRKATFKDVIWVTVSHNHSISKLQHDIAKRIGLKLDEDDERVRADNLCSALEKKGKSILILDDVWKYIDLQKVGIHPKVNGIKVILTTRLKHVCHQMDCQPYAILPMYPLSACEGWELFMLKLGVNGTPKILPYEIEKIARCIVERFKGLPLAINVMARTMKGINDFHQWKDALNKLEKLEMEQMVEEEVFKVLKPSYDNLMEKNLQNCFLYCALLSIDDCDWDRDWDWDEFEKDELIMKLVDHGQINGSMCLEEIFVEGNTILNKLESHSLISVHYCSVVTHPLLRNMACYIWKESQRNAIVKSGKGLTKKPLSHGWVTDLELVHMRDCDIEQIPEGMSPNCPKLSTLIINKVSINHVPESFFKYMNSLSILDLSDNEELVSLPNSVSGLRSLVSLVLKRCASLIHVPPLGELQALSRLVISETSIEQVPIGLEKLTNLKWLDLSKNMRLNLELRSFSSYLIKLQYLDLRDTHAVNTVEDVQGMNMLECFGGAFDYKCFNQSMQKNLDMSFERIKTYNLILGIVCSASLADWWHHLNLKRFGSADRETKSIQFGDCDQFSHILPKDLTCLLIYQNNHLVCLCDALSYNTTSSLRKIGTSDCQQMESLFCLSGSCSFCTKIHSLEVLILESLKSLTVLCKEVFDVRQSLTPFGRFSCLKQFDIRGCHLIEKLFTPQLVLQLQNLEIISVMSCDSMKEIFAVSNSDDNDRSIISLPKLTELILNYLPQLKIVCKGSIRCGSSLTWDIYDCPSLEREPTFYF